MPIFTVTFTKEFDITVQVDSTDQLEAALKEALRELDRGMWETGDWDTSFSASHPMEKPDHGIKDGKIVAIEDIAGLNKEAPQ